MHAQRPVGSRSHRGTRAPSRRGLLLGTALGLLGSGAAAQPASYPQRPLRLVLGFPPGGATDHSARMVALKMAELVGQPIVVENRPGASGNIAAEHVARSAPDGYTLLYTTSTVHAINPNVHTKLPYDPVADFAPVLYVSRTQLALLVHNELGVASVAQLLALARSRPGRLGYASAGLGSTQHLAGALFCRQAGIEALHVPYKGSSPALTDLISGQVDFMIDTLSASLPFIRGGRLRALAVSGRTRAPAAAQLPTLDASGVKGYEVTAWGGIVVPRGTPADVVRTLNAAGNEALRSADIVSRAADSGSELQGGTPERFGAWIGEELARWKLAVAAAGVVAQ